jgi:hypothetical protein
MVTRYWILDPGFWILVIPRCSFPILNQAPVSVYSEVVDSAPRQGRTKVFTAGVEMATPRIETCGERSIGAKDAISG